MFRLISTLEVIMMFQSCCEYSFVRSEFQEGIIIFILMGSLVPVFSFRYKSFFYRVEKLTPLQTSALLYGNFFQDCPFLLYGFTSIAFYFSKSPTRQCRCLPIAGQCWCMLGHIRTPVGLPTALLESLLLRDPLQFSL